MVKIGRFNRYWPFCWKCQHGVEYVLEQHYEPGNLSMTIKVRCHGYIEDVKTGFFQIGERIDAGQRAIVAFRGQHLQLVKPMI